MKIAASKGTEFAFECHYKTMDIDMTDFTNVCAVVATVADLTMVWEELERIGFAVPISQRWNTARACRPNGCPKCMA